MHVEIAQHHVVHVKLRRARRHSGHEVRPEEGRRRGAKQRQRRRGEAGRPGRKRMEKLLDVARMASCEKVKSKKAKTVKTKGPGGRDGERSFGRHPSNSVTTPDTKRTKGPGARGGERSFVAATHPQQLVHDPAE